MGKSVSDYYAEKMQKLLEAQKQQNNAVPQRPLSAPQKTPQNKAGRDYYDKFRRAEPGPQKRQTVQATPVRQRPSDAVGKDDRKSRSASYTPPKATAQGTEKNTDGRRAAENTAKRKTPEQTEADRRREERAREEAIEKARRARRFRKLRDAVISFVLIIAVFGVMCVFVYRLLFVISNISAEGNETYSSENIVAASGVGEGDHLYSFRSSVVGSIIKHRCPQIVDVDVTRRAPSTITFNVTEEKCMYYADFYGEYRAVSESLRVLFSLSAEEAENSELIYLKLPAVQSAVAGERAEFATLKNDSYIYDVVSAVADSELSERVGMIDLRSKYDIKLACDGKYLLTLGEAESVDTKLRIARSVLDDDMFKNDDKARIDLSDLSKTSVVVDNQITFD